MRSPRLGYWCPPVPEPSGIADYGDELLRALAPLIETVHVSPPVKGMRLPDGVAHERDLTMRYGAVNGATINLFHVGNHAAYHATMLPPLLRLGGVVVLHELSLFDLFWPMLRRDKERWFEELDRHGPGSHELVKFPVPFALKRQLHCLTSVVEAADVVVVHTEWARTELRRHFPTADVRVIPHACRILDYVAPNRTPTVLVLGGIGRHKGIDTVVRAFGEIRRRVPGVTMRIVGRGDDRSEIHRLKKLARHVGVASALTWATDVTADQFDEELRRSSLVITLRPESLGEMSGVLARAWGAGRVAVTSAQPQFAEFPETFCPRVDTGEAAETELAEVVSGLLTDYPRLEEASRQAHEFADTISFSQVAQRYHQLILEQHEHYDPPELNIVGAWGSPTGLAEKSRRLARGLIARVRVATPYSFTIREHDSRVVPREIAFAPKDPLAPLTLWTNNINEMNLVREEQLGGTHVRPYNIALWIVEFDGVAPLFRKYLPWVDEVWAGSTFAADVFRRAGIERVVHVPDSVEVRRATRDRTVVRGELGVNDETPLFLYTFDFSSGWNRKNPLGLVRAFADAFPDGSAQLVLKASGMPPQYEAPLRAAAGTSRLEIINAHLSEGELGDLFHACDVYASLHRAEGFGLGMAEAMMLGKTVVATNYSGNLDFTREETALLVDYTLVPVGPADVRDNPGMADTIPPGATWAEPRHDHAVEQLRRAADPALRRELGPVAARFVAEHFAIDPVAEVATARLRELQRELGL